MTSPASTEDPPAAALLAVPRDRVSLERLLQERGAPQGVRILAVSGSAGSGKSTLLRQWADDLRSDDDQVGWLTVRPHHDDPTSLWVALLSTLDRAVDAPRPGSLPSTRLSSFTPSVDPHLGFADEVAARLAEQEGRRERPAWIFLDDLHLLRSPESRRVVHQLLVTAPPSLRFVLASRSDSLAGFSRLRLAEPVLELRDADLRFSPMEARQVLRLHGVELGAQQLERLMRVTEGWAAGVRLAAMSLSTGRDADDFLASCGADEGPLANYLVEEVLDGLDDEVVTFLRHTAVVPDLPVVLAEELSGRDDAAEILHAMAAATGLVTRTSAGAPQYRYHSLLRAHLAADLRTSTPDLWREMHRRAARWHRTEGDGAQALFHAVQGEDVALVRTVLLESGLALVLEGQQGVVVRAFHGASRPMLQDPVVAGVLSLAQAQAGDVHTALRTLDRVAPATAGRSRPSPAEADSRSHHDSSDTSPDQLAERLVELARVNVHRIQGTLSRSDDARATLGSRAGRRGPSEVRPPSQGLRDLELAEHVLLGDALMAVGELTGARELLHLGFDEACEDDRPLVAMHCMVHLSVLAAQLGDLPAMERWALASIDYAAPRGWAGDPQLAFAYVFCASGAYERLDMDLARRMSERATAVLTVADSGRPLVSTRTIDRATVRSAQAIASYVAFEDADRDTQRVIVRRRRATLEELVRHPFPPALVAYELWEFVRMALEVSELGLAEEAIRIAERLLAGHGDAKVMRAALLVRIGHHDEAGRLLAPVTAGSEPTVVVTNLIIAWLLSAVIACRRRRSAACHTALGEAVAMAAPRDAMRVMLEVAPEVLELLRSNSDRFGRDSAFVTRVLAAADSPERLAKAHGVVTPQPVRPLTAAELSLLRDLPSLMSVPQLAAQRQVSPNTVKTQIRSIFSKLQVDSRRDAVAVGRRLGLL